jgi:uncharacterized damage-inducible protein DinB
MDERALRHEIVNLLRKGQAHVTVAKALAGLEPRLRHVRPGPRLHSVWEELEHMRIAQEDILRYTLDPAWKSPEFPRGYWPPEGVAPTETMWESSVACFEADLGLVVGLAEDVARDLTAEIPHGEGRTYLRQILLVADHNAYHAGEIVQARKLLGAWPR